MRFKILMMRFFIFGGANGKNIKRSICNLSNKMLFLKSQVY